MPDMDGVVLIKRMRETFPEVPVIALSGGGAMDLEMTLEVAGALGALYTAGQAVRSSRAA